MQGLVNLHMCMGARGFLGGGGVGVDGFQRREGDASEWLAVVPCHDRGVWGFEKERLGLRVYQQGLGT